MAASNDSYAYDVSAATTTAVAAAVAGKRIEVLGYTFINGVATAQSVVFKSGTTAISGVMQLPQSIGGGLVNNGGERTTCLFRTAVGSALNVTQSAATQVGGHISFRYV